MVKRRILPLSKGCSAQAGAAQRRRARETTNLHYQECCMRGGRIGAATKVQGRSVYDRLRVGLPGPTKVDASMHATRDRIVRYINSASASPWVEG